MKKEEGLMGKGEMEEKRGQWDGGGGGEKQIERIRETKKRRGSSMR